jgi:1,2-diacylglycerol 3-alpha-glucosyltransferase
MDILMLSDVYFPRVNGVSTSIRTFVKSLLEMGHHVTLVAPDYGVRHTQRACDTEFGQSFEVIRVQSHTVFFDKEDRLMKASALRAVRAQLSARHWDVIHVHTPFAAHRLGVHLARNADVPVVETYHTYFEAYIAHYLPWLSSRMLRVVARRLSRSICQSVDHIIVPTAEMDVVLKQYGVRTTSTVLPTGIDLSEFQSGDGHAFRQRYGIDPQRPLIVTISRLAIEKNIEFLLRVTRELVNTKPNLLFVIAGEGPDTVRLTGMVDMLGLEHNVRFFGNLDRKTELLDCYRAADAFVFASPTETQGLVLIEAMALGVPIVSTAVMGTAAVLRGARSAIICDENVTHFAAGVGQVLSDHDLRNTMAAAGPRDAEVWNCKPLMRQVSELYGELARDDPWQLWAPS